MPALWKYPPELRERAIRLVAEARKEDPDLSLNAAAVRLSYRADTALVCIDLRGEPGNLYQRASDSVRRGLLTAYFSKLIVRVKDNKIQMTGERNDANHGIRDASQPPSFRRRRTDAKNHKTSPLKSREVGEQTNHGQFI